MPDQLARLQEALGGRYTLQRELGRGGMATVYLAEDLKHHRPVALKVLKPELAAVLGPDRFLREIELAAKLTHPHILPVYDSGRTGGPAERQSDEAAEQSADGHPLSAEFLYYVMPYVEGESLRDRLTREKQLPLDDALQISREVADALSYAHGHGVIHRDIKPENILSESGHAVVADFGIARAVSTAGGTRLTETGLAVGTPAYMSPEQAAGTQDLDGRSDLYSLACVLYEMLAGHPPFAGATAHELLARHAADPVPPLRSGRTTIPEPVAAAVAKALEKVPADRFPTARAFGAALTIERLADPRRHRRPRLIGRVGLGLATTVVLVLGAYGAACFLRTGRPGTLFATSALDPGDRVLLADFVNRTDDSTIADAVREGLRALLTDPRLVRLLDPATVREALARMGRPPGTRLDDEVAQELAEREQAKAFVTGEVSRLGTGYQFTARVVGTAARTVLLMERVTARDDGEVIAAVDQLGKRLRRGLGESVRRALASPPLARVSTASLAALRAYSAGARLEGEFIDRAQAIVLLQNAVALDSTFASAYRLLAVIFYNANRPAEALAAADRAFQLRDRLPEAERLVVEARYHGQARETDRAEVAWRRLLALDPNNGTALVGLSDIRLGQRRWVEAESLAVRALDLGGRALAAFWNALEAQLALGRFAAAESVLARAPPGPRLEALRLNVLLGLRDWGPAARYLDSLDGPFDGDRVALPVVRGRLADGERQATMDLFLRLWWALVITRYSGDTARSARVIDASLRPAVWDSVAPTARPYSGMIAALAGVGRIAQARRMLAEWRALGAGDLRLQCDVPQSLGAIAMAEGQFDSAASAFLAWHRAPFCGGTHEVNRGLPEAAAAHDHAGRADTAIALYERALGLHSLDGLMYEATWYPLVLRRLGELHEARGDRAKAMEYYNQFVELWKDADTSLQPQVVAARARLAELVRER